MTKISDHRMKSKINSDSSSKKDTDRGPWAQTTSGKRFYPLDPRKEEVDIDDIASALAKICRFNGHSLIQYSVAQHCVLGSHVAEMIEPLGCLALQFLLHDAAEAYVGDVIRPLRLVPVLGFEFAKIEDNISRVIYEALDVKVPDYERDIKVIDDIMLATERRYVMMSSEHDWRLTQDPIPLNVCREWTWETAEQVFMRRYEYLTYAGPQ